MPELVEQMYCSQQIVIPPKFPYILKRFCKAAIKTQPYDLLRWSFEYFRALAEHRTPPVKLRLEYPIYSTEGGLTRGCLKVIAQQLAGIDEVPLFLVKKVWRGFCLDPLELQSILCMCEVWKRADTVPYLDFIAVAGGMLTKCLTHTMILLCESLTKEPDGGSAAISVGDFLKMYLFLAVTDASGNVKYLNGYREGHMPVVESSAEEEEVPFSEGSKETTSEDSFWKGATDYDRISLIDYKVAKDATLSTSATVPLIGKIERSPSVEREHQIERENFMSDKKSYVESSQVQILMLVGISYCYTGWMRQRHLLKPQLPYVSKLRLLSYLQLEHMAGEEGDEEENKGQDKEKDTKKNVEIVVFDEDEMEVEYEIYGEPVEVEAPVEEEQTKEELTGEEQVAEPDEIKETEADRVAKFVAEIRQIKEERVADLQKVFEEIAAIVKKFKSTNYDLGMVAGRQMSTTSGEYIVQHIEKEIMDHIDDQIAILPDPDLKKKKAKPEEVEMVRGILETFLDENMDTIVPEIEEVEEEEPPLPEITVVHAVPGIGPVVPSEIINEFVEYIREISKIQNEMVMPRNLRHYLCPPLEKYLECNYDNIDHEPPYKRAPKEEVAVDGAHIN